MNDTRHATARAHRDRRAPWTLLLFAVSAFILPPYLAEGDDPLAYRDRGDRHEGVRLKPITGEDLELLAVIAEGELGGSDLGTAEDQVSVRFFLPRHDTVFLTVREPEPPRYFYWLDQVEPREPWRPSTTNTYSWSRSEVLDPLGLEPGTLVPLVRLGEREAGAREQVAPAWLGRDSGSLRVASYRFLFKTNAAARLEGHIVDPEGHQLSITSSCGERFRPAATCTLRWIPDADQAAGHYRLSLRGHFLADNTPLVRQVEFFHTPSWPP